MIKVWKFQKDEQKTTDFEDLHASAGRRKGRTHWIWKNVERGFEVSESKHSGG